MRQVFAAAMFLSSLLVPVLSEAASTVSYARVEVRNNTSVKWFNGAVSSRQDAEISAEVGGRIVWMAEFGERVEAGEVLARVDDRQLKLQLQSSRLELSKARQNREYLRTELDRLEALHEKNSLSRTELDRARHEFAQAELDVEFARVQVSILEDRLSRAQVKAPFPGVVGSRSIQPNEHVQAGDVLLRLVNPDNSDIRVQIPIEVARNLDYEARLKILANDDEQMAAVSRKGVSADQRSRLVEVRLDPDTDSWLPGSPVRIAVPVILPIAAKVVPRDAVVMGAGGNAVFKIETESSGDRTVREVPVQMMFGDDQQVSIIGDIMEGDIVVVRGASTLKDKDRVVLLENKTRVL
ncbi:MAG: efflux RND transporter periplasmic adaptor subunit [Endozoicomonas sp.]